MQRSSHLESRNFLHVNARCPVCPSKLLYRNNLLVPNNPVPMPSSCNNSRFSSITFKFNIYRQKNRPAHNATRHFVLVWQTRLINQIKLIALQFWTSNTGFRTPRRNLKIAEYMMADLISPSSISKAVTISVSETLSSLNFIHLYSKVSHIFDLLYTIIDFLFIFWCCLKFADYK